MNADTGGSARNACVPAHCLRYLCECNEHRANEVCEMSVHAELIHNIMNADT